MSQAAKLAQNAQAKKPGKQQEENSAAPTKKHSRQPEKKFGPFAGGIGVCVWVNTVQTEDGPKSFRSITINPRRYFDRETNEWKDAPSYNPTDLPALIFSLERAQAFVFEVPLPGTARTATDAESPGESSVEEQPF